MGSRIKNDQQVSICTLPQERWQEMVAWDEGTSAPESRGKDVANSPRHTACRPLTLNSQAKRMRMHTILHKTQLISLHQCTVWAEQRDRGRRGGTGTTGGSKNKTGRCRGNHYCQEATQPLTGTSQLTVVFPPCGV